VRKRQTVPVAAADDDDWVVLRADLCRGRIRFRGRRYRCCSAIPTH
jgi:hypothetical protein